MQAFVAGALLEAVWRAAALSDAAAGAAAPPTASEPEPDAAGAGGSRGVHRPSAEGAGGGGGALLPAPMHEGLQLAHPLACYVWSPDLGPEPRPAAPRIGC